MMVIVIQPIRSTYRMYVWNKFVQFDLLLNFIIQEEVETKTKRLVIIQFQTNQYQYRQQQKSISDFDIYWYRYNNKNKNKRQSESLFCLERKKTGPLCWYQHHRRNRSGLPATATTKKTNQKIGTTTTMMMIVIQPIRSTYRIYVQNKFVNFDYDIHFDCDF